MRINLKILTSIGKIKVLLSQLNGEGLWSCGNKYAVEVFSSTLEFPLSWQKNPTWFIRNQLMQAAIKVRLNMTHQNSIENFKRSN